MQTCLKYRIRVQYHSTSHDIFEIYIPTKRLAFHYVHTIVGKSLVVIDVQNPRSDNTTEHNLSTDTIEKICTIHDSNKLAKSLEQEIHTEINDCLFAETVMFDDEPTLDQLKRDIMAITKYSKSKVNSMTRAELQDIMDLYEI